MAYNEYQADGSELIEWLNEIEIMTCAIGLHGFGSRVSAVSMG